MPQLAKHGPIGQQVVEKSSQHAKVKLYPSTDLYVLFRRVKYTGNDKKDFKETGTEGFCSEADIRTISLHDRKRARVLAISSMKYELKSEGLRKNATINH